MSLQLRSLRIFSTISGGKISWIIESSIFFDSVILLHMWTKEEKEVTELLSCKQIISILIASTIKFVTSNKKPRFDALIKS